MESGVSSLAISPHLLLSAAADMTNIESTIREANTAAASTTAVAAAGSDEISTAVAALFSDHGRRYQLLGAQAAAFHQRFVQLVNAGAGAYAATEAAGNGGSGAPGQTGGNGGAGGLLFGDAVYVANEAGGSLWVIDPATNTVTAIIPVGSLPAGVAANHLGSAVYVANSGSNNVSAINPVTDKVIATIPVGQDPTAVAVARPVPTGITGGGAGCLRPDDGPEGRTSIPRLTCAGRQRRAQAGMM